MAQDSSKPDFWETRYQKNFMPWDAGRIPIAFKDFVASHPGTGKALIPGCGSAYEARYLVEAGWDVLAIDFSPAAVEAAGKTLGEFGRIVKLADFFHFDYGEPFDLVYERAFLAALPRQMWTDYAVRMAEIIKPRGLLAGYFFYDDNPKGPPFGTNDQELASLLSDQFTRIADAPVSDSIPVFQGKERWQVWQRR